MMTKALRALPPSNYSEAAVSQLAIYAEEYRRGSFAVNAPTGDVLRLAGRAPESFESIVRRTVAGRPDLKGSFPASARAVAGFLKILLAPALDLARIQSQRDHVRIEAPRFSQETPEWVASHAPAATPAAPVKVA